MLWDSDIHQGLQSWTSKIVLNIDSHHLSNFRISHIEFYGWFIEEIYVLPVGDTSVSVVTVTTIPYQ
jgi:hypothetical protein